MRICQILYRNSKYEKSVCESNAIKEFFKKPDLSQREKILLDNLLNKKPVEQTVTTKVVQVEKPVIKTDTLKLECDNIIEEFLLFKSYDDVNHFIETRCVDALSKNKFCEHLINKFFCSNKDKLNDIIELIKQLVKLQTLYKSNLSRGLLLIYNNWKDRAIDYNKPNDKMILLLQTLKHIGITKGIEHIMEQYKIN